MNLIDGIETHFGDEDKKWIIIMSSLQMRGEGE
jgi:hypothetical protein